MKQEKIGRRRSKLVCMTAFTLLVAATRSFAQTVPLSNYTMVDASDGATYSGVLVGGNPFGATAPFSIDAVLIPMIIDVLQPDGTIVAFDPTAPNSCDPEGLPVVYRFQQSPLVVATDLKFNGVDVGKAQYIDGFMRAQFWNAPHHNRSSYTNHLNWSFPSAIAFPVLDSRNSVIQNPGTCNEVAVILGDVFNSWIETYFIPELQKAKVISPTQFAFFLTKNVVTANTLSPVTGIKGGAHRSVGSPAQTWARAASGGDINTASHEIAEWMNDPFLTNKAPSWGYIGEDKTGCSRAVEVGDPTNGTRAPSISTDLVYYYNPQELTFFSWFFTPDGAPSWGAGGKFSSNGKFTGPSKLCNSLDPSSGGTYK
jgi:hypothetical protein